MPSGYEYVVKNADGGVSISTAITILQIKAGAAALELVRATLTQRGSTTSTSEAVQLLRKTAAATVTSFTPRPLTTTDPASLAIGGTAATGYTATAEGTDGNILVDDGFNILNGWLWVPTIDRISVPQGGIIAMKFPTAPAAQTWRAAITFIEYQ